MCYWTYSPLRYGSLLVENYEYWANARIQGRIDYHPDMSPGYWATYIVNTHRDDVTWLTRESTAEEARSLVETTVLLRALANQVLGDDDDYWWKT